MFRSHWTIIREHLVAIPKLPLIVYQCVTLWFCAAACLCEVSVSYTVVLRVSALHCGSARQHAYVRCQCVTLWFCAAACLCEVSVRYTVVLRGSMLM